LNKIDEHLISIDRGEDSIKILNKIKELFDENEDD